MFTYIKKRDTSAYYEFQYCKEDQPPEILVTPEYYGKHHFLPDSLLIYIDDERFFPLYIDYLTPTHSPDGSGRFSAYGVNYYDRDQTKKMIARISADKPLQYKILVDWLGKAAHEYNGFYFLGI